MPFVFIFVLGFLAGFAAAIAWQRILKDREQAQRAKVAHQEAQNNEDAL